MSRALVVKIIIILAVVAALLVGVKMLKGTPAQAPSAK